MRLTGPAVVDQVDATTLIPPGWTADVDRFGNLLIRSATATSDVVGSMTVLTRATLLAGKPPRRACSSTRSLFGAM